ncbi:MAG: endonuclease [Paludibacteraceae bacterium]|nr:endonuclease [Paludibacteraceae bacterium]
MKKIVLLLLIVCASTLGFAATPWIETFGTSVSKDSQNHWPYIADYTGYDHKSTCTYDGWNASIRQLDRYADYGPHAYLAANKDSYLTIEQISGGTDCEISFDAVCYLKDGASSYKASDVLTVSVNGTAYSLSSNTMKTDAFTTFKLSTKVTAETFSLRFGHAASVAQEVRVDNITVTYGEEPSEPEDPADPEDPDEPGEASDCPYPQLEGKKGFEILSALQEIIQDHTVLSYDDIRADKAGVDIRDNGTVWDMYSSCSFTKKSYCPYGSDFPECDCYNREHALPKSYWKHNDNNPEPMYTDLHHVLPTDFVANSMRSNNPYGEVTGDVEWSNALGSKVGYSGDLSATVFEPADEYKGDIARIYFYMLTCYKGKNFAQGYGYKTFSWSNNISTFTYAMNKIMMKWHRNDPVSKKEIDRNEAVALKQGNRNPFIDAPELAEYIWGSKTNKKYSCSMAIESIEVPVTHAAQKILHEGHLYILRDGKIYTVTGAEVR